MKKIVLFLLTLLGFSSVYSQNEESRPLMKYGVPHATFQIKGKVVNALGRPIKGVQVIIKNEEKGIEERVISGKGGRFEYSENVFPSELTYLIQVEDIDGKKNKGDYEAANQIVNVEKSDYKDTKDPWDRGVVLKEKTIVMTKKISK